MKIRDEVELRFPSDFKYLGAVDAVVQDLAREFSFSPKCIDDISTALIEACTNAIAHGNKFAKDKRVKVAIKFVDGVITTEVCDEGSGFDYRDHMENINPPDTLSVQGRGIIIMTAFSDALKFNYEPDKGLSVEMTKSRSKCNDKDG